MPVLYGPGGAGRARARARRRRAGDRDGREARRGCPREAGQLAGRRLPRDRRRARPQAVVSAGNTGAMLAAGLLEIRRLAGRDAAGDRRADPRARRAVGAARLRRERGRARRSTCSSSPTWARSSPRRSSASPNPEVRLLSIGEEPEKGNQLDARGARAARRRARSTSPGNTEGRELLAKAADVVVTDGFTGNVALKALEGTIRTVIEGLRDEITATTLGKLGGLLIRPAARRPAAPARPGHVRRRLPARAARARRDRPRQLVARRRSRTRSAWPRAASSTTSPGRLAARLPARRKRRPDLCMIGRASQPPTID